jgi:predicted lipid-binding transport protein (Tim44 family)
MGGSIATGLLMAVLVGIGVMLLMRVFAASRRPATAGAGNPWPAMGAETPAAPPPSQAMTQPIDAVTPAAAREPAIPAGFDVDGFLNQARHGFTTLYAAHDRGDLAMMREFTTDGMYAELRREIESRSGPVDPVKVITLEAELLEVVTEGSTHWASVRFSGMLSENASAPNEPFNEVWNLCQPVNGATGWLLAGIQQVN